jgi:Glu-tRNA(Gln) amidotransferase subunit E-like FAD-binding protein
MKLTKEKLRILIKEEVQSISEGASLSEEIAEAMIGVTAISTRLEVLKRKNNPQLIADLLVKIHKLVRPEGSIVDLFSRAKGASERAAQAELPASGPEDTSTEV